jgi:hypothetical protein
MYTPRDYVGVNVAVPLATLHVRDAGATRPAILVEGAGSNEGDIAWPVGEVLQVGAWNEGTQQFSNLLRINDQGEVRLTYALTFDETAEDKISLFGNRLGQANNYGFGVSSGTLYYKTNQAHSWFVNQADTTATPAMYLRAGGLGIGTTTILPGFRLTVNGSVRAKEIVVETGWADFVFAPDYRLRPLEEVASFIASHGHLPDIPPAEEIERGGVPVGEMTSKLLQKIEELTLYLLEVDRQIAALRAGHERPGTTERAWAPAPEAEP